eukprot:3336367-Prymnesium_polylepis.1
MTLPPHPPPVGPRMPHKIDVRFPIPTPQRDARSSRTPGAQESAFIAVAFSWMMVRIFSKHLTLSCSLPTAHRHPRARAHTHRQQPCYTMRPLHTRTQRPTKRARVRRARVRRARFRRRTRRPSPCPCLPSPSARPHWSSRSEHKPPRGARHLSERRAEAGRHRGFG